MTFAFRRKVLLAAAAALVISEPMVAVARAAPLVIEFSQVVAPGTPKGNDALRFKVDGERVIGGAQGNGGRSGAGQAFNSETEIATSARDKP
jgi:hypothetical protein